MLKTFLLLLSFVESGNDPSALGDIHPITKQPQAVGCLQMWSVMVDDCNRILSYPAFNDKDRLNPKACFEMARIIYEHYEPILEKRFNVTFDDYDRLAFWCYGPTRWKPSSKSTHASKKRNKQYDYFKERISQNDG